VNTFEIGQKVRHSSAGLGVVQRFIGSDRAFVKFIAPTADGDTEDIVLLEDLEPIEQTQPLPPTQKPPAQTADPRRDTFFARIALPLAKMGLRVFPLREKDKLPVVGFDEHQKRCSKDENQILAWASQYPNSNVGVHAIQEDGGILFVDDDKGDLRARYEKETGKKAPVTLMVQSRPGREHAYFYQSAKTRALDKNLTEKETGSFSLRVQGYYVVGIGSIHPITGLPYVVSVEAPIAPMPDDYLEWLLKQKSTLPGAADGSPLPEGCKYPHGQIHNAMVMQARKLLAADFRGGKLANELIEWTHEHCEAPINESEVIVCAKSIETLYGKEAAKAKSEYAMVGGQIAGGPPTNGNGSGSSLFLPSLKVEYYSDIKFKKLKWFWQGRIPLGKLTIFAGNPDTGKSLAGIAIAANATTGDDFIDCENEHEPCEVILLEAEDDPEDTIGPRLAAAGVDLTKMIRLHEVNDQAVSNGGVIVDVTRTIQLDRDLLRVEDLLKEKPQIKLLIISPMSSYIGEANLIDEKSVRRALAPLQTLAAKYGIAIVAIMHLNKSAEVDVIYRISGAMGFVAVARATWLFATDKEDEDKRYMLQVKGNLAKKQKGLVYTVKVKNIVIEGEDTQQPYLHWIGTCEEDANEVMQKSCGLEREDQDEDASVFVSALMRKNGWSMGSSEFKKILVGSKYRPATVARAKDALGIVYDKPSKCYVMYPIEDEPVIPF
jgi:putative DNA primase/helicase